MRLDPETAGEHLCHDQEDRMENKTHQLLTESLGIRKDVLSIMFQKRKDRSRLSFGSWMI